MSLAARLSWFFLAALAVVMAGFSVGLYLLARTYLYRQVDERLEAALDTLAAAAEVKADCLEWEPHERLLSLGREAGPDEVRWTVHDDRGRRVDGSRNLGAEDLPGQAPGAGDRGGHSVERAGEPWRVLWRRLLPAPGEPSDGKRREEQEPRGPTSPVYAALAITAGVSLRGVEGTLRTLALALAGLSAAVLAVAALLGRRLCRRALQPVQQMAEAARSMGAADLNARLPGAETGDELEDLRRAFNDLLGRLQEAFERQRRFTGDASHQLRTPLAVMLGQIEVALRRDRPAGEYREVLNVAHGQAHRLRQIVEMLLFLARADAEARLPHLERLDLASWVAGHLGQWSAHARGPDLRVVIPDGAPRWVLAQPALLGQLLDNLLENACKYSEPDTPITVRLGSEAGAVTLAVEDAGLGISSEDMPHLFEPFYRSAEARRLGRAGVGLGLAVARRIAGAFGGTLEAHSEPGRGSRFVLRLPGSPAPEGAPATAPAT